MPRRYYLSRLLDDGKQANKSGPTPAHVCTGTGPTPAGICARIGAHPAPQQHQDSARPATPAVYVLFGCLRARRRRAFAAGRDRPVSRELCDRPRRRCGARARACCGLRVLRAGSDLWMPPQPLLVPVYICTRMTMCVIRCYSFKAAAAVCRYLYLRPSHSPRGHWHSSVWRLVSGCMSYLRLEPFVRACTHMNSQTYALSRTLLASAVAARRPLFRLFVPSIPMIPTIIPIVGTLTSIIGTLISIIGTLTSIIVTLIPVSDRRSTCRRRRRCGRVGSSSTTRPRRSHGSSRSPWLRWRRTRGVLAGNSRGT